MIFIPIDNLESIYARFSIHRQQVDQIFEIKKAEKFVTICAELTMNVIVIKLINLIDLGLLKW
jgi:hypothetical protein